MADILHDVPIAVPAEQVFQAVSTPAGLDQWWTKRSAGEAVVGSSFELWFGPPFDWRAVVTRCKPPVEIEFRMVKAEADWIGTRVGFTLRESGAATRAGFYHIGWPTPNEHYRISTFCWAMYLRILKRYLEQGETVPYERRLEV